MCSVLGRELRLHAQYRRESQPVPMQRVGRPGPARDLEWKARPPSDMFVRKPQVSPLKTPGALPCIEGLREAPRCRPSGNTVPKVELAVPREPVIALG